MRHTLKLDRVNQVDARTAESNAKKARSTARQRQRRKGSDRSENADKLDTTRAIERPLKPS